jgi:hypothetical protein
MLALCCFYAPVQVEAVNGQKINNLQDLVCIVDHCKDEYLDLDLDHRQKVVLHTQRAKLATQEILSVHCISNDRSVDLIPESIGEGSAKVAGESECKDEGTVLTDPRMRCRKLR